MVVTSVKLLILSPAVETIPKIGPAGIAVIVSSVPALADSHKHAKLQRLRTLRYESMTWEYASTLTDGPARKDTLDALGADGWELVSVVHGMQTTQLLYVFKRPGPGTSTAVAPEQNATGQRTEATDSHADARF